MGPKIMSNMVHKPLAPLQSALSDQVMKLTAEVQDLKKQE
jgi:hypothetical protein